MDNKRLAALFRHRQGNELVPVKDAAADKVTLVQHFQHLLGQLQFVQGFGVVPLGELCLIVLPESLDDFIILESEEKEEFTDAWRLYGGAGYKKPEEWPEDNSLYRAFKQRVLSGGKTGSGFGIVIFDGEKVVK